MNVFRQSFIGLSIFVALAGNIFAQKPKIPENEVQYARFSDIAGNEKLLRDFDVQGIYEGTVEGLSCLLRLAALGNGAFRVSGTRIGPDDRLIAFLAVLRIDDHGAVLSPDSKAPQGYPFGPGPMTISVRRKRLSKDIPHAEVCLELPAGSDELKAVSFEKVVPKSSAEGMAPPANAIVLFPPSGDDENKNLDMFRDGARIDPDTGCLLQGAITKPIGSRPYRLHLEFFLPYMPNSRGQARANGGVYIDQSYEVQILDSFGFPPTDNTCGAIYHFHAPATSEELPPMCWQTLDIVYRPAFFRDAIKIRNARMSVSLNGKTIIEEKEVPGRTPAGALETEKPRGILFQAKRFQILFRNIWLEPL